MVGDGRAGFRSLEEVVEAALQALGASVSPERAAVERDAVQRLALVLQPAAAAAAAAARRHDEVWNTVVGRDARRRRAAAAQQVVVFCMPHFTHRPRRQEMKWEGAFVKKSGKWGVFFKSGKWGFCKKVENGGCFLKVENGGVL